MAVFDRMDKAGEAVSTIITEGIAPAKLEIIDKALVRAVDDFLKPGFPRDAETVLLLEVDGYEVEVERQVEVIEEIFSEKASNVQRAKNDAEMEKLWFAYCSGNGALGCIKPSYMVQDVIVPRHRPPEMLRFVSNISKKYNITIVRMVHAGDGNLHPHILYEPDNPEEFEKVEKATREIFQAALKMERTLTEGHGVGVEKPPFMEMQFNQQDIYFMRRVKMALALDLI